MLFVILRRVGHTVQGSNWEEEVAEEDVFYAVRKFNDQAAEAGVLRSSLQLCPSSNASRVSLGADEENATIERGPFDNAYTSVNAMWVLKVDDEKGALGWARRLPNARGEDFTAEVRQVYSLDNFSDNITPELRDKMYHVQAETAAQSRFPDSQAAAVRKQERFLVLQRANATSEAGVLPNTQVLESMAAFHEGLVAANALLAAERLHPSLWGARVRFPGGGRPTEETRGPFPLEDGVFCGFWLIQAESLEEAEGWMARLPRATGDDAAGGQVVWIRQVLDEAAGSTHQSLYDYVSGHQVM